MDVIETNPTSSTKSILSIIKPNRHSALATNHLKLMLCALVLMKQIEKVIADTIYFSNENTTYSLWFNPDVFPTMGAAIINGTCGPVSLLGNITQEFSRPITAFPDQYSFAREMGGQIIKDFETCINNFLVDAHNQITSVPPLYLIAVILSGGLITLGVAMAVTSIYRNCCKNNHNNQAAAEPAHENYVPQNDVVEMPVINRQEEPSATEVRVNVQSP